MTSEELSQLDKLARGLWWVIVLRGVLAIVFGIIALIAPAAALTGIVIILGAYLLVDGAIEIVQAIRSRGADRRWGWLLLQGVVSLLGGLAALLLPDLAGLAGGLFVLWIIVIYGFVHGAVSIATASGLRGSPGNGWAVFSGVLSILFAIVLAVIITLSPSASVLSLIWVAGVYVVIFGAMLIIAAFAARRAVKTALA